MIWVAIMATLGIGGGFAGLTWSWVSDVRAMDRERARCRRFGWCEFHVPGRLFQACPCGECRFARVRIAFKAYNAKLAQWRRALLAQREATRDAVAAMQDLGARLHAAGAQRERDRSRWRR